MMKKAIQTIFDFIWPEHKLVGEHYEQLWIEKKRNRIFQIQLVILPALAALQVIHFAFIDKKIAVDLYQFWFFYRLKVTVAFLAAMLFLIPSIFNRLTFPRLPIFASGLVLIYYQTYSINATDYPVPTVLSERR